MIFDTSFIHCNSVLFLAFYVFLYRCFIKANCTHIIAFRPEMSVPKFVLREVFCGEKRRELEKYGRHFVIGKNIRRDQVHMLAEIPPKIAISSLVGYLMGKSSLMI